jgi:hypothetical protein
MSTMTVTIEDIHDLDKALAAFGEDLVREQIPAAFARFGVSVQREARGVVSVDTGELRKSISVDLFETNRTQGVEIGPLQPYGEAVERGRPPHVVSPKALEGWARRRGLNPYAVARSIAKKGTKAHPYLIPSFEAELPNVEGLIFEAADTAFRTMQ